MGTTRQGFASYLTTGSLAAVCFVVLLLIKVAVYWGSQQPQVSARQLPSAPLPEIFAGLSSGDRLVVARLATLWLQAFDNQPGISMSFQQLAYPELVDWLDLILSLEPKAHYPLLLASRVYGEVGDRDRQRQMFVWVEQVFLEAPERRWRWLAHAALVARHGMKDQQFALDLARSLSSQPAEVGIPGWARQMEIFLLEQMGFADAAAVLLGGVLESGTVTDPAEQRFLLERLRTLRNE